MGGGRSKPVNLGPGDPLTKAEILEGVGTSGYPLEVRLLKRLTDAKMFPIIGMRIDDGAGDSREVDIVASISRTAKLDDDRGLKVVVRLIIEAKSLEPGAAFIGFPWEPPNQNLDPARVYFGGSPSNKIITGLPRDTGAVMALATAFGDLNRSRSCVQWAVARRTKPGRDRRVVATHDDSFWRGIDGVVRSTRMLMYGLSNRRWKQQNMVLEFDLPVLVVATPSLWLCDASGDPLDEQALQQTPRMILKRQFQVHDRTEFRLVDVVAETGLDDYVTACKLTAEKLSQIAEERGEELWGLAQEQQEILEKTAVERALRDYAD